MSLSQLRIYLALIFFFLIGAIEYKVLTDNKQNLSMQYTKELKTLLYDISYLLVWEIEKENDVEAPLVKGILNNSNITHKYIKNIGLSSDNIVTYSTDKKMISNPLSKPLIMTETLDASQIFDDQYIGVTFNYYLGNSQYSQLLFIEIDQDIVQKHFWSTHVIPSIELILAILVFVAILLLMIDHLLVQPIINLSTLLPREDVENKLPTYYLTEMEFLKKRFLSAIRKIKKEQKSFSFLLTGASYYKVNQFLLVDLFLIGFNISVTRVGRTGAWDKIPSTKLSTPYL
mgnify:CR=1 FL=1